MGQWNCGWGGTLYYDLNFRLSFNSRTSQSRVEVAACHTCVAALHVALLFAVAYTLLPPSLSHPLCTSLGCEILLGKIQFHAALLIGPVERRLRRGLRCQLPVQLHLQLRRNLWLLMRFLRCDYGWGWACCKFADATC